LPCLGKMEKPDPVPDSIDSAVAAARTQRENAAGKDQVHA